MTDTSVLLYRATELASSTSHLEGRLVAKGRLDAEFCTDSSSVEWEGMKRRRRRRGKEERGEGER